MDDIWFVIVHYMYAEYPKPVRGFYRLICELAPLIYSKPMLNNIGNARVCVYLNFSFDATWQ